MLSLCNNGYPVRYFRRDGSSAKEGTALKSCDLDGGTWINNRGTKTLRRSLPQDLRVGLQSEESMPINSDELGLFQRFEQCRCYKTDVTDSSL